MRPQQGKIKMVIHLIIKKYRFPHQMDIGTSLLHEVPILHFLGKTELVGRPTITIIIAISQKIQLNSERLDFKSIRLSFNNIMK